MRERKRPWKAKLVVAVTVVAVLPASTVFVVPTTALAGAAFTAIECSQNTQSLLRSLPRLVLDRGEQRRFEHLARRLRRLGHL